MAVVLLTMQVSRILSGSLTSSSDISTTYNRAIGQNLGPDSARHHRSIAIANLPTGTVTFLFTDIEGSTKRWEEQRTAMSTALARHDALMREAIEQHSGYVFKTVGDAFCAAFPTPLDTLSAALAAQHSLFEEQWEEAVGAIRVRMSLHTGSAEERGGDYFGPPVNRVARLLSAGHGGQVLLSEVTYGLVRDDLPSRVELRDLGEHRLKDLLRPEHAYQLVISGLPSEFPPLKTLDNHPNNLPRQTTALVGREKEVAEVTALMQRPDVALVTLTGPGGIGKTRLSLQAAANLIDDFKDGVFFVDLSPITDHALVASAIGHTLGVTEGDDQPILETLKVYLHERAMILVLDNFEQVTGAANVVSELLASAPGLKVLVSSRIALHIRGEKEYAVPTLSLPDLKRLPPIEQLTQYDSVRLFIERATDAKSDFQITNESAPAVAEICHRLDGLPLAIELAAARVKMLPPQAILSRLQSRLKLLTGGSRDLSARRQTLRGAIEWSYDLLSEGEQQLFTRMSVFNGGRTLEALEAVCNYDEELEIDVFDGVDVMINNSLLQQREGSDGEPRFWMLETIQEYAREKLQGSGTQEAEALEREHALYFMRLAEEAEPHLKGAEQKEWLDKIEDEHDNLRSALSWARRNGSKGAEDVRTSKGTGAPEVALRIGVSLMRFWEGRGYVSEGREQLARAIANGRSLLAANQMPGDSGNELNRWLARGLMGLGRLALRQGDYVEARVSEEESVALSREVGDLATLADALNYLAFVSLEQGDSDTARPLLEESLALRRKLADKGGISSSLSNLGYAAALQEDFASARRLFEEALTLNRELGDKNRTSIMLANLANVAATEGDYATARALWGESIGLAREMGDLYFIAQCLGDLGTVLYLEGAHADARRSFEEALPLANQMGDKLEIARDMVGLGGLAAEDGARLSLNQIVQARQAAEKGARLLGAADLLMEAMGVPWQTLELKMYNQVISSASSQLGDEAFEKARQEGRNMSMEQAIALALEVPPAEEAPIALQAEPDPVSTSSATSAPASNLTGGLSEREIEVLRLVAGGLTNAQVAERLFLSPPTINAHLRSIYSKLGVTSRGAATRFAVEHGLT